MRFIPANEPMPETATTPTTGIAFRVDGIPAPQGSKRHVGNGVLIESSKKVKPWREAVAIAAVDAMNGHAPYDGPVTVNITFHLPAPKTVRRHMPHVRPDLDKLTRSTLDALTTAQVFGDDSQVCDLHVAKRYGTPGADVTVTTTEPEAMEVAA